MPKFFLILIAWLAEANVKLRAQRDEAEYMATHDVLTGLPNRAYLHTRMRADPRASATAMSSRSRSPISIPFKSINDTYGHEYGDFLLAQVADAMKSVVLQERAPSAATAATSSSSSSKTATPARGRIR